MQRNEKDFNNPYVENGKKDEKGVDYEGDYVGEGGERERHSLRDLK